MIKSLCKVKLLCISTASHSWNQQQASAWTHTWQCRHWHGPRAHSYTVAAAAPPQLIYAECAAPKHDNPVHPECAARGRAIFDALAAAKLDADALPGQVLFYMPALPAVLQRWECMTLSRPDRWPNLHKLRARWCMQRGSQAALDVWPLG